jgi:integrase
MLSPLSADDEVLRAVQRMLVKEMHRRGRAYWGWSEGEWLETIAPTMLEFDKLHGTRGARYRRYVIAMAYLLGKLTDLRMLGSRCGRHDLACLVFGAAAVNSAVHRVWEVAARWGYTENLLYTLRVVVSLALLDNRDPRLERLTLRGLERQRREVTRPHWASVFVIVSRALSHLGILPAELTPGRSATAAPLPERVRPGLRLGTEGVPPEWVRWCLDWYGLSPRHPYWKEKIVGQLLKVGRWLRHDHPEVVSPRQWTYELAAEFVAASDGLKVGDLWSGEMLRRFRGEIGKPLMPSTKAGHLAAVRSFFCDLQEYGKIPVRFNPTRAFATPRHIKRLIAPDPRVVDDAVWAKILWAGMNLTAEDLPRAGKRSRNRYPPEMVRALAAVWCFGGLRSDEIRRLRVGCVRWQREGVAITDSDEVLPKEAVCFLHVPVSKTNTAFTKPVHPLVGERIAEWERLRPAQPPRPDRKTGEMSHPLFSVRGYGISPGYLNDGLIPLLCRKAGVPESDARGRITSHRARATIATMLYNARAPMSLLELMEWLGHRHPGSTQHYAKLSPTKLAKAYVGTGYMERNLATVEVLLDAEALAAGEKRAVYYDMGWALCSNPMWWQCRFRMACVKCDFCVRGDRAVLIRSKEGIRRMREDIPLTEDEEKALDGDEEALDAFIERNADVPTPAGKTPREMGLIPLQIV